MSRIMGGFRLGLATAAIIVCVTVRLASAAPINGFMPGDLVISTVSCSVSVAVCNSTSGGLDTASPITLQEFQFGAGGTVATPVGTLTCRRQASAPIPQSRANMVRLRRVSFRFDQWP